MGSTLTASPGSWSGDTPITFTYQWQDCNAAGGSCAAISGATNQTYTIGSADAGQTLRVDVTAHNGAGVGSQLSAATAVVSAGPPVNTAAPTVSGTFAIGHALTATSGTWSGAQPISISYQWERCDTSGGNCNYIGGATAPSYTVTSSDAGHRLVVAVTASNSAGNSSATVTVGNLAGGAPVTTAAPRIVSGSLSIGSALTVSTGTWTGTQPITISYQWERCDTNGGNCASIGGATGASYRITTSDAGHRLIAVVTARNSLGSHQVVVTAGSIGGGPPVNTVAPKVSGSLSIGATLTITSGTWSGTQPISIAYQWERCDTNGGNCQFIAGATGTRYTVTSTDAGHRLVAVVTAKNSIGTNQAAVTAGNVGGALPNGAILVAAIALPDRLVIDRVSFSPNPATSRAPITARFHVSNSQGRSVQGALVFALGLPYGWTYNAPESPTGADGWVTLTIRPTRNMPLHRGDLVMFVRARKPGGNLLAGVSTRRLVQEPIR